MSCVLRADLDKFFCSLNFLYVLKLFFNVNVTFLGSVYMYALVYKRIKSCGVFCVIFANSVV